MLNNARETISVSVSFFLLSQYIQHSLRVFALHRKLRLKLKLKLKLKLQLNAPPPPRSPRRYIFDNKSVISSRLLLRAYSTEALTRSVYNYVGIKIMSTLSIIPARFTSRD